MKLDIVGTQEAAVILGVEVGRVSRWKDKGRMPPLVADLGASPVWRRADVVKLARRGKWSGPAPEPLPIMGLQEAAEFVGISKRQITRLRKRGAFPEPRLEKRPTDVEWKPGLGLGATPVWLRSDLEDFVRQRAA